MITTKAAPVAAKDITLSNGAILPAKYAAYAKIYEQMLADPTNAKYIAEVKAAFPTLPPIDTLSKTPEGEIKDTTDRGKEILRGDLAKGKTEDLARLDDVLAARGVSRSGAVGAGSAEISQNYADALAKGELGYDTQAIQSNLAAKQQSMMQKYYDAISAPKGTSSVMYAGEFKNPEPMGLGGDWTAGAKSDQINTSLDSGVSNTTPKKTGTKVKTGTGYMIY